MTRYEYMTVPRSEEQDVNNSVLSKYGQLGWRLVHTGQAYFQLEHPYHGDK